MYYGEIKKYLKSGFPYKLIKAVKNKNPDVCNSPQHTPPTGTQ